jgi:AraC family transcriptional regulator
MPTELPTFASVNPPPVDRSRFDWGGGVFECARRPFTARVEGCLTPPEPVLMATLRGGAEHHQFVTEDGYRHAGPDLVGTISFLPGDCTRRLHLKNVAWQWASITLRPLAGVDFGKSATMRPFSADHDGFVLNLLSEVERLHAIDRRLDATYCDTMTLALVEYLGRRYLGHKPPAAAQREFMPPWRLRRVMDYIEAHLADDVRIATLAQLVDLSEGHFHRAFRATTGQTPLAFITSRRIEAAKQLLASGSEAVCTIAPRVGFVSPSHFARIFRWNTGVTPREYRRQFLADQAW